MLTLPILLVTSGVSFPVRQAPLPPALKELQGEWRAVAVEEKGRPWGDRKEVAEVVMEITGDTLIHKRAKPFEKFRLTLDADRKPARIDLRLIDEGVDPTKVCAGIYALDGGRLKLCLPSEFTAKPPEDRPTEFTTGGKRPPQGRLLIVLERVKKE